MTAVRDATIAARIPLDLREDLEAEVKVRRERGETRPDGEPIDLSTVVRIALRRHVDAQAGFKDGAAPAGLFAPTDTQVKPPPRGLGDLHPSAALDNGKPGAVRQSDPNTSHNAALEVAARAGSQRRVALEHFEAAGAVGLTADEVVVLMAPRPHNGTARRVTDLLQGGLIEPIESLAEDVNERGGVERILEPTDDYGGGQLVRKTRAGGWANVYRISAKGLLTLGNKRREEAGHATD